MSVVYESPRLARVDLVTRWLPIETVQPANESQIHPASSGSGGPRAGMSLLAKGGRGSEQASVPATGRDGSRAATHERTSALTITASVESEDRAGDLVLASGWDISAFERNPVVLWAHQHLAPPVGRSLRTWVEGKSLKAVIEFAPTPFAQEVRALYEGGFLRGVSVGFRAVETEPRQAISGRRGTLFRRQELLEISAAPVPLNPDTLAFTERPEAHTAADRGQAEVLDGIRRLWKELGPLTTGAA